MTQPEREVPVPLTRSFPPRLILAIDQEGRITADGSEEEIDTAACKVLRALAYGLHPKSRPSEPEAQP